MEVKMKWKTMMAELAILAAILCGCECSAEEPQATQVAATPQPITQVSVKGKAAPETWAAVSSQASGTVLEVLVKPGDDVAAGDLLVRLDSTDAQLTVQQAEATLATRQAELDLLKAGPSPEEIAVAEAQIEAAQATLSQSVAQRDQLKAGTIEAEIAAAQAELAAAESDVMAAREAHKQTMKCYSIPHSGGKKVCPLLGPAEEQARANLYAAEESLAAAQAQVDALVAGTAGRTRAADAAALTAEAQLGVSQARLKLLEAGASREEIAVSEAAVGQAEIALAEAQTALERCEIHAPFAGTVGAVHTRMGELVAPGQPLVTIGDLSTLHVETTDLDDVDVAKVSIGQPAAISFPALPGQDFAGRVARISPMAEPDNVGGYDYTVVVELDEVTPEILWGMDAFVSIETE
jgi:multidrug resistance efflux pump